MLIRKSVLIADDDPDVVKALKLRCELIGLAVRSASDALPALAMIQSDPPDLVILDVNMPTGNGLCVCETLATDKDLAPIPVIILTGRTDPETIERCEKLGAHYVEKGFDVWERVKPLLYRLLCIQPSEGEGESLESSNTVLSKMDANSSPKVLVVGDDMVVFNAIASKLTAYRVRFAQALNGMQGYWMALKERPDVIIADSEMREGHGDYLLRVLKGHPLTRDIPVILLASLNRTGEQNSAVEHQMYKLGAAKVLHKPFDIDSLMAQLRNHVRLPAKACLETTLAPRGYYSYHDYLVHAWNAQ